MPKLPYASLSEIRSAILQRKAIAFHYGRTAARAEPHMLVRFRRGALVLLAWDLEKPGGWRLFRYAFMRELKMTAISFMPRTDLLCPLETLGRVDTAIATSCAFPLS